MNGIKKKRGRGAAREAPGTFGDYAWRHSSFTRFEAGRSWVILSPVEQAIRRRIEAVGTPLKDWDVRIFRGVLTGCNEAFIISGAKKDELVAADPKSAEIIRPILRGRDIKRYAHNFADLWLIATFPSRRYNIDDYPAVKRHLLSFGMERLEQTGREHVVNGVKVKARKKTGNQWFETQDSISYWEDFYQQKIIYPNMTKFLPFYLDFDGFMTNQKAFFITGSSLSYLCAFFNSALFKFCFHDNFPQLGDDRRELSKVYFETIPVMKIENKIEEMINNIVVEMQNKKHDNKDTKNLEHEIDNIIFSLYGMHDSEIEYIYSNIPSFFK